MRVHLTIAFFFQTNESGVYNENELAKLMVKPSSKQIPDSMKNVIEKCNKNGI